MPDKKPIEIQAIGTFFQLDEQGFLINPSRLSFLPPFFPPLLKDIQALYQKHLGSSLRAIYLRGSLVRGTWRAQVSDIDTFALVDTKDLRWSEAPFADSENQRLQEKYPFANEIEFFLSTYRRDIAVVNPNLAMVIRTQACLLWGDDLAPDIPAFRINKALKINTPWFAQDLEAYLALELPEPAEHRAMAKCLIRVSFELVMERAQVYTCDLFPAVDCFRRYYPEEAALLSQILFYYLNPTENTHLIRKRLVKMGQWLKKVI